jgi:hypothetical protein
VLRDGGCRKAACDGDCPHLASARRTTLSLSLSLAGSGATVALAPRLAPGAHAALSPIVGAGTLAIASTAVPYGAPVRLVGALWAATLAGLAWHQRAGVWAAVRAARPLLVVVPVALALAGAPSLARGDWRVLTLFSASTDAYHWVSQANAFLDGPAPAPSTAFPDRLTFERIHEQHWAVALPVLLAQVAWMLRLDPALIYAALAAIVYCLLPLAVHASARGAFEWSSRVSVLAALAVAGNASLLFASYFSWQQQILGTAFSVAGASTLWWTMGRTTVQ